MSRPISTCLIAKAIFGEPGARKLLDDKLAYAKAHGAFTLHPCECDPPCPKPTEADMTEDRIKELFRECPHFTLLI